MKKFLLDGHNMKSVEETYDEINNILCPKFNRFGRSFNAFIDILRGGFRAFSYGESIIIQFKYVKFAQKHAGESFINKLIKFMDEAENVELLLSNNDG